MTATGFVILAYVIGLGLLWGYGVHLWRSARTLARRRGRDEDNGEGGSSCLFF